MTNFYLLKMKKCANGVASLTTRFCQQRQDIQTHAPQVVVEKYYMHAQGGKELRSISQKEVMSRPGQREKVAKQAKLSYEAIKEQVRM